MTETLLHDPHFQQLKTYIIEETGLNFYKTRSELLADRCIKHMAQHNLTTCKSLLEKLQIAPTERDKLIADLTVGETYFFRQTDFFQALKTTIFPELIARKQKQKTLRIWSAGCATGPEAYSISIMLKQTFGIQLTGWDVAIIGTDINKEHLKQAHQATYNAWALRDLNPKIEHTCFNRQNNVFQLKPQYREQVTFQYHNLVHNVTPSLFQNLSNFDLILCRNVMIYFSPKTIVQVVNGFYKSLSIGGWLAVGHAENNAPWYSAFNSTQVEGITFYQKPNAPTHTPAPQQPIMMALPTPKPKPLPNFDHIRQLANAGSYAQALHICQCQIAEKPLEDRPYFYAGLLHAQLGQIDQAEKSLRQARYLNQQAPLTHYHLALLKLKKKDMWAATQSFQNVLQCLSTMSPDHSFEDADNISVKDLKNLTHLHLDILNDNTKS